jgi:hypothetical protein
MTTDPRETERDADFEKTAWEEDRERRISKGLFSKETRSKKKNRERLEKREYAKTDLEREQIGENFRD